jgi:AcrR family transcriptional regulator
MTAIFTPNPTDPRVIRTRHLILDAFVENLNKMDFNAITISDITKKATINRATFYAHFPDKYALLDALFSGTFLDYIIKRVDPDAMLTEETIEQLIVSLCDYHESTNRCVKKYDSVAPINEKNIKIQLEKFILQLLSRESAKTDSKHLELTATMLCWSLYGITFQWNIGGRSESPIDLSKRVLPMIFNGISWLNTTAEE